MAVLVVDDDPMLREILTEILQEEGYRISTAENGLQALDKISDSFPFDIVLSDLDMPEMGGMELLANVRQNGNEIPFIVLTASSDISTAMKAIKKGASDYLIKDENISETIILAIKQTLEKHQIIEDKRRAEELVKKQNKELAAANFELERINNQLLEYASLVQKRFLPEEPPQYPNFEFAGMTVPAKTVGGDFYDFIPLGKNRLGILVGDVSGKGVTAALFMAKLVSDFRQICHMEPDPEQVMSTINSILHKRSTKGMFVTAIYSLLDMEKNTMHVSNAGHLPVFIRSKGNEVAKKAKAGGVPLGIFPDTTYPKEEILLETGDLGLIFTDGAIEPTNHQKEPFGLIKLSHFLSTEQKSPQTLIKNLHETITGFSKSSDLPDDLTLLAFKLK